MSPVVKTFSLQRNCGQAHSTAAAPRRSSGYNDSRVVRARQDGLGKPGRSGVADGRRGNCNCIIPCLLFSALRSRDGAP